MDNTEEFRCISLCTGYAGIELGLRRVVPDLRTVAYVEIEAFAAANLVAKIEAGRLDAAPVWTDIKSFPAYRFRDRVHIITAGYPCQPFSIAGKRKGSSDPRHLWPDIERIVKAVRPVWCFFENVPGHLTLGFPTVYRSLRAMGYKVEAGLFTASEVGAPHRRQRLFILANRECAEPGLRVVEKEQAGIGWDRFTNRGPVMADDTNSGRETSEIQQKGKSALGQSISIPDAERKGLQKSWIELSQRQTQRFPARPGQPQYEWEEPRVVGDAEHRGQCGDTRRRAVEIIKDGHKKLEHAGSGTSKRVSQSKGRNIDREVGNTGGKGQTQSGLGRAANGTNCRVDRLRLLGNGVVPQQAELAFRTLIKLFE